MKVCKWRFPLYLTKNKALLAVEIVEDIIDRIKLEVPKEEIEQGFIIYAEFIGFLGDSGASNEKELPEGLTEWSKRMGGREASLRGRISEVVVLYPTIRVVFVEQLLKSA
ncbi:hypothetical protein PP175_01435 [Aneurinibacillus sp. Ricciae_BoGa-3]|uniref:hypothetical protein n=1 Tax=Aneurinibacillus sp. Ricciae_BoGa-3 TaxID=3022697 RepID=UPI0023409237|nr:hypothetical protein [Aneurinibacillus sp. Ricciae_BoGa-3]WCK54730.1 hypothetical protein PP175_01435 [Aneurinibacillus sp. Ricciae_BoGa-3]